MGRYYSGDIDGKFWVAVQSSDAADRFGASGSEPNYINYYFDEDNLEDVEAEIQDIENSLGEWKEKLDNFFDKVNEYNDQIVKENGLDIETFNNHLSDYADLDLGIKIRDCIKEHGQCNFEAEI